MADLSVSVVSASLVVGWGAGRQLGAPTTEGEIGILPGHEPMLGILAAGEVRVTLADGTVVTANAEDGFLSVDNNVVTIVARNADLVTA